MQGTNFDWYTDHALVRGITIPWCRCQRWLDNSTVVITQTWKTKARVLTLFSQPLNRSKMVRDHDAHLYFDPLRQKCWNTSVNTPQIYLCNIVTKSYRCEIQKGHSGTKRQQRVGCTFGKIGEGSWMEYTDTDVLFMEDPGLKKQSAKRVSHVWRLGFVWIRSELELLPKIQTFRIFRLHLGFARQVFWGLGPESQASLPSPFETKSQRPWSSFIQHLLVTNSESAMQFTFCSQTPFMFREIGFEIRSGSVWRVLWPDSRTYPFAFGIKCVSEALYLENAECFFMSQTWSHLSWKRTLFFPN